MGNLADVIEASMRSRTWKERHAKGVPVKLSLDTQEEYNKRMQWYDLDGENDSHLIDDVSPYVVVFASPFYKKSGSFRNFRYKPEWLEKKGGSHETQ